MKQLTKKNLFAFIITALMFSVMPALVNAQKKCPEGNCPKGQACVNGYCIKSSAGNGGGGTICNCSVRPIPFECGQICGWLTGSILSGEKILMNIYNSGSKSATFSFSMEKGERISAKIFDNTGRLVTTLADKLFEQGKHKLLWDTEGVNAGIYFVQFNTGAYNEIQKISVIK